MNRRTRAARWLPLAGTSAVLLTWGNVVVPALPSAPGVRTAVNLAASLALVLVARAGGLSWDELGLGPRTRRAGALWGGAAFATVATCYAVALALPGLRTSLDDPRVGSMTAEEIAVRVLVLIPLGTVLSEEVAFRGVLSALASRVLPAGRALIVTSTVFGLWHLASARPPGGADLLPGAPVLIGTVVVTGAGGLLFGWLRQRSGSLLAPVGAHLGSNSLGLLASAAASH